MTAGNVVPIRRELEPEDKLDMTATTLVGPVLSGDVLDPEPVQHVVTVADVPRPMPGDARPIIPRVLADPETRRAAVRNMKARAKHRTAFHSFRSPLYVLMLIGRTAVGASRLAGGLVRWVADAESKQHRVSAPDAAAYVRAREQHDAAVRGRVVLVVLASLLVVGGLAALVAAGPSWGLPVVFLVGVVVCAWAGRTPDRPVLRTAFVAAPGFQRLTEPIVMRALVAAGLGGRAAKDGDEETAIGTPMFVAPGVARDGVGWLTTFDLPRGRTFQHAAAKREEIASGLDVASVQVFLEGVETSARRVVMWISDRDPYAGRPNASPLSRCPVVDVWHPQRIGVEPRGREVCPTIMFNAFLIGAIPRQGKTYLARTLVGPAVLDGRCDLTVLDLKGGRDWKATEHVAVTYRSGDDDDDAAYALAVLRQVQTEARARFEAFRQLSDDQCPESKLTVQLAALGMLPHVVVVDEVQNLLKHPVYGKQALPVLVWLAKTAPAAGFTLVLATQRPAADVIPADLRDNISIRLALKTMDWRSSDTILGASAASIGIESHSLMLDKHRGVAVVRGVLNGRGGDHQTVRTDLVEAADFARMCQIGRQRRLDLGTLRGIAAGDPDTVQIAMSLPADVLAVWPAGQDKATGDELAQRLGRHRPDRYQGWTADVLTRALNVPETGRCQVKRGSVNQRGYKLDAVAALAQRGSNEVAE